ncbi:MAG: polysaccharide deacetylase family protein [Actinobacteria bacterium]|nr:polysaccharide deacetylase family protein [Actinomycetota bacterium]MCL5883593.1 polysaccharide deacetylase family protein [Actinomycetota bacterium]
MTKRRALSVLGSLAGGFFLTIAAISHWLYHHHGQRRLGIRLLLGGAIADGLFVYSTLVPNFPLGGKPYYSGRREGNRIALTFDDGPRAPYTAQILDTLKKEGVPATFFVLGENARRHPELVKRIEVEGHRVGNHGFDHSIMMFASGRQALAQVDAADSALRDAGVADPAPVFRAPHGWLSPLALRALSRRGYLVTGWSKGVWDTASPGVGTIISRTREILRPGNILLLHDGWSGPSDEDRSQTVEAVAEIIRDAKARGLQFVTVEQMLREEETL